MTTRQADSIGSPITVSVQPSVPIPMYVHETAARLGVSLHLQQVIDLTREIFGTFSRVTISEDPEFVGDVHILFHVPANGTIEEQLDKDEQWGRRLLEIIPRSPQVYLIFPEFSS